MNTSIFLHVQLQIHTLPQSLLGFFWLVLTDPQAACKQCTMTVVDSNSIVFVDCMAVTTNVPQVQMTFFYYSDWCQTSTQAVQCSCRTEQLHNMQEDRSLD